MTSDTDPHGQRAIVDGVRSFLRHAGVQQDLADALAIDVRDRLEASPMPSMLYVSRVADETGTTRAVVTDIDPGAPETLFTLPIARWLEAWDEELTRGLRNSDAEGPPN